jgi:hypothetical protein
MGSWKYWREMRRASWEKKIATSVSISTDVITNELLKAYKRQVPLFLLFCSLGSGMYSNKM